MAEPKFTFDAEYLAAKDATASHTNLCLRPSAFYVLARMSEMLLWPTRWGLDNQSSPPPLAFMIYNELNNPGICVSDDWIEHEVYNRNMIQIDNNITCGSCCGGSGEGTAVPVICVNENGDIVPSPTVTPDVPKKPDVDPAVDPSPIGENWTAFDENACRAANALWQFVHGSVSALENAVDWIVGVAVVATVILAALPAGIAAALSGAALWELLLSIADFLAVESASDILLSLKTYLDDERESLVCGFYRDRHDIEILQVNFLVKMLDYLADVFNPDAATRIKLTRFLGAFIPLSLLYRYFRESAPADIADAIDCQSCPALPGYPEWVGSPTGDYCVSQGVLFSATANTIVYTGDISKAGEYGSYEWLVEKVDVVPIVEFSGQILEIVNFAQDQNISCDVAIGTSGGEQQHTIPVTGSVIVDTTGLDVTYLQLKFRLASYTGICPFPCSGEVRVNTL